jgi:hypothetical protein
MISRRTFSLTAILTALSPLTWCRQAKAVTLGAAALLGFRQQLVDELLSDSYSRFGLKDTKELRKELMS